MNPLSLALTKVSAPVRIASRDEQPEEAPGDAFAALIERPSPRDEPIPISALPAPDMTLFTSAKSTLIRPGVVIRSVIPCTPLSSTSSADRKASIRLTAASPSCSSRSFGITIKVSQDSRNAVIPASA